MDREIFELTKNLGKVAAADEGTLRTLVVAAEGELTAMLKPNLTPRDCDLVYTVATALFALAALRTATPQAARFSAGDLTVEQGDCGPQELRRRAVDMMRPYLADEGFSFLGVDG